MVLTSTNSFMKKEMPALTVESSYMPLSHWPDLGHRTVFWFGQSAYYLEILLRSECSNLKKKAQIMKKGCP